MLKAILFDFDGTLLNTNDLITGAFNHISLMSRGVPFSTNEHTMILGKPLDHQLKFICPDDFEEFTDEFHRWYRENHDHYARPYEDVEDMLNFLKYEGYRIGIVTNNSRNGLGMGLSLLGMESLFDVIVTRDDVAECKPSPEGILMALGELNVAPHECMYVGDSTGDIFAARAAGAMGVLVAWTTMSQDQVNMISPVEIIETPYDIPFLINLLDTEIA